jgi:hypothetical protein
MPLYGAAPVTHQRRLQLMALGWSATAEQRDALSAAVTRLRDDLDPEVARADPGRREWPCRLRDEGVLRVVPKDGMVPVDPHPRVRVSAPPLPGTKR